LIFFKVNSYQSEYSNDANLSNAHKLENYLPMKKKCACIFIYFSVPALTSSPVQEMLSIGSYSSANRISSVPKQPRSYLEKRDSLTSMDSFKKPALVSMASGGSGGQRDRGATMLMSSSTTSLGQAENLSMPELREVVLTMIQRKEQLEETNKNLRESLGEEKNRNYGLVEELNMTRMDTNSFKQTSESRMQNLENENKLLKEQLKKYVSAVQMIRSNNNNNNGSGSNSGSAGDSPTTSGGNALSMGETGSSETPLPPMPALNQNLQRDYSYEAEQYEKKLIQVCELN
jgi:hypothetical protein